MVVRIGIHTGGGKINSIVVNNVKRSLHVIDGLRT